MTKKWPSRLNPKTCRPELEIWKKNEKLISSRGKNKENTSTWECHLEETIDGGDHPSASARGVLPLWEPLWLLDLLHNMAMIQESWPWLNNDDDLTSTKNQWMNWSDWIAYEKQIISNRYNYGTIFTAWNLTRVTEDDATKTWVLTPQRLGSQTPSIFKKKGMISWYQRHTYLLVLDVATVATPLTLKCLLLKSRCSRREVCGAVHVSICLRKIHPLINCQGEGVPILNLRLSRFEKKNSRRFVLFTFL